MLGREGGRGRGGGEGRETRGVGGGSCKVLFPVLLWSNKSVHCLFDLNLYMYLSLKGCPPSYPSWRHTILAAALLEIQLSEWTESAHTPTTPLLHDNPPRHLAT